MSLSSTTSAAGTVTSTDVYKRQEQLCTAALDGDTEARNALVENNLRFIKRTAYEMWSAQQELNAALGIEINDLVQEGSLGLLDCIAGYRPDTGNKFLTYAAPAIRNAMAVSYTHLKHFHSPHKSNF